jgi:hypothetical protein
VVALNSPDEIAALVQRGRQLAAAPDAHDGAAGHVRSWQRDCAALVSRLCGGNKSHWLSRAFSEALLVPHLEAGPRIDAPVIDIITRIVSVLERAAAAMSQSSGLVASSGSDARAGRRFEFVREPSLRPVLERAYLDSREAFDRGSFGEALLTSCSILEAIVTDALRQKTPDVQSWTFEERIAAAEREGLIRGGCARLPAVARCYRDLISAENSIETPNVSERDARVTGQVLHVIMRDLDPGR